MISESCLSQTLKIFRLFISLCLNGRTESELETRATQPFLQNLLEHLGQIYNCKRFLKAVLK